MKPVGQSAVYRQWVELLQVKPVERPAVHRQWVELLQVKLVEWPAVHRQWVEPLQVKLDECSFENQRLVEVEPSQVKLAEHQRLVEVEPSQVKLAEHQRLVESLRAKPVVFQRQEPAVFLPWQARLAVDRRWFVLSREKRAVGRWVFVFLQEKPSESSVLSRERPVVAVRPAALWQGTVAER